jgi:hypothetical protein
MGNETTLLMYVPEFIGSSTFQGYDPEVGENKDHTGWIPVDSCSFALSKDATATDKSGSGEADAAGLTIQVGPISVKRSADYTTADMLAWLATSVKEKDGPGVVKEQILIDFCLPSGRYYLRYELLGVQVVGCDLDFNEDDVGETIKFIYEKIRVLKRPILPSGEVDVGGEDVAEYEVPSASSQA